MSPCQYRALISGVAPLTVRAMVQYADLQTPPGTLETSLGFQQSERSLGGARCGPVLRVLTMSLCSTAFLTN
jgi:hypothetical protein